MGENRLSTRVINSSIENIYSLTPTQEGMLFHHLENISSSEYIVQNEFKLEGVIEVDKIKFALQLLSEKHSVLRTAIVSEKIVKPRQIILKNRSIEISESDFSQIDEKSGEEKYEKLKSNDLKRNFNLKEDTLLRVNLVRISKNDTMLLFTYHHIIMDGWSLSILYGDFLRYYEQLLTGIPKETLQEQVSKERDCLPEYGKYVQFLEKKDNSNDLSYWSKLLEGYESDAKITPIYKKTRIESAKIEKSNLIVQKKISDKLIEISLKNNVTINNIMEAAWAVLLTYYSNTLDVVFGKIVSGRDLEGVPNIEKILGAFINTIPVRVNCDEEITTSEFINELKIQDLESASHSHVSLVDIQNLSLQKNKLINTLFVYENYYVDTDFTDLATNGKLKMHYYGGREQTNYPITVIAKLNENNHELSIAILYDTAEFHEFEISNILKRFNKLLESFSYNLDGRVNDISLLLDDEMELMQSVNETETIYPKKCSVVELFEEQVRKKPKQIAVILNKKSQTYEELNEKANQIANFLKEEYGVDQSDTIGIIAEKTIDMIAAIIGILKTGASYLPIDKKNPRERVQYILNKSDCKAVLTFEENHYYKNKSIINFKNYDLSKKSKKNPVNYVSANSPIYVMFTSGTTGKPKGVTITHKNVIRLVKNTNYVDLKKCRILQTGSLAFDASTFEIWGALLNAGTLVMTELETLANPDKLQEVIIQNEISTVFLTSSLFNQIVEINPRAFNTLKELLVGGEKVSEIHIEKWRTVNKNTRFLNAYGPTESTTFALFTSVKQEVPEDIPLGKPISNTKVYVMNGKRICGIGITGELCLGGDGVGLGYINDSEQTVQKFVSDVFEKDKKMYRTGDLASISPDGNIYFKGRIDEQIKIRGFRIEVNEIAEILLHISEISEVVVLSKEIKNEKYLCAYIVAIKKIDIDFIKAKMSDKLPEYMIPTYFVFLKKLPLNQNGKVDKNALPEPKLKRVKTHVVAKSDKEIALIKVFEEVLGIEQLGRMDRFFDLGGDSIKAIRIVSKYRNVGYITSVSDIMSKNTIQSIARAASLEKSENNYCQEEIEGVIYNTPAIKEFQHWSLKNPNLFTQSVLLKVGSLEKKELHKIFNYLLSHHDILRARYNNSYLEIKNTKELSRYFLDKHDLTKCSDFDKVVNEKYDYLCKTLDLKNGPLIKAIYFKGKKQSILGICIHHLLVDAISWKIIIDDLTELINCLAKGKKLSLPRKTASFYEWSKQLEEYQKSQVVLQQKKYWDNISDQVAECLLIPHVEKNTEKDGSGIITIRFSEEQTWSLLRKSRLAFNTEINDLFLAALGLTVNQLLKLEKIAVTLEGHGREKLSQEIDIDRTVGWFTTMYPILIDSNGDIAETIIGTKEMLRTISDNGLAYGLLKEDFTLTEPDIRFNYLGELVVDNKKTKSRYYQIEADKNNDNHLFSGITMNGSVSKGNLVFDISYQGDKYSSAFTKRFAQEYQKSLLKVIEYCSSAVETIRTPSDFPVAGLSMEDLSHIFNQYGNSNVENIYSLTALQEGMVLSKLNDENSTTYVVQQILDVKNVVDPIRIEQALHLLFQNYEVLRSTIFYEKLDKAVLVVLKKQQIEFEIIDLSKEKDALILFEKIKENDVDRGFNLQEDSLLRVKLIFLPNNITKMVWCFHHIIMDGWCMSLLYKKYIEFYQTLESHKNFENQLEEVRQNQLFNSDYGDYLQLVTTENHDEGLNYWEELLESYEGVAEILPLYSKQKNEKQVEKINMSLSTSLTKQLVMQASNTNATMSTLIETAVGILLMNYNHESDVVFGKIVSGRELALTGIEEMVGLFINTIPVRITCEEMTTVGQLIDQVNKQNIDSGKYSRCSLAEIQKKTRRKRDLFKILFVYENYYVDQSMKEQRSDDLTINVEIAREQTDYPLTIAAYIADNTGQLEVTCMFDPVLYTEKEIRNVIFRLEKVLTYLVKDLELSVNAVETILDEEKNLVLSESDVSKLLPIKQSSIIQLFEQQVNINPNQVAASNGRETISYKELDSKANQLATFLSKKGVSQGDKVAIVAEKNFEMLISICAILKLGGVYVPIDKKTPDSRISYILEDCQPKLMISLVHNFEVDWPTVYLTDQKIWEELDLLSPVFDSGNNLACIMYTSGTTGKPKGNMITQKGIIRLVIKPNFVELNKNVSILQTGSLSFDASLFEIWGALLNGGKIVLTDTETLFDPELLKNTLRTCAINTMWLTSSLFNQLIQIDSKLFKGLSTLLVGGEKLSEKHIQLFKDQNRHTRIINGYGPTENTTFTCTYEIPENFEQIYIGKPISQTKVYVLNGTKLCGFGMPGELCIVGQGLSQGYLNQPVLTEKYFVDNPYGEGKMYRTGDFVCLMPDGNIKFLSRLDEQVKIRGYRVELDEIAKVIKEQEGIEDSVVIVNQNSDDQKSLHSYFTAKDKVNISQLKHILSSFLPEYMMPTLLQIEKMPITQNGKLDQSKLPLPIKDTVTIYEEPLTKEEIAVCKAFEKALTIEKVSIFDNFFELGGDSIRAIRIVSLLRQQGFEVTVKTIMSRYIVKNIAADIVVKLNQSSYDCEQGEVTGEIEDTPIIKEFKSMNLKVPEHFNQEIFIPIPTDDFEGVQAVFRKICTHHDILRAVFREKKLRILSSDENSGFEMQRFKCKKLEKENLAELFQSVNKNIDLENGPLCKILFLQEGRKNYLFISIHHLVIDGVSWRILIEDIYLLINQLKEGKQLTLPDKTTSFMSWATILKNYQHECKNELGYWLEVSKKIVNEANQKEQVTEPTVSTSSQFSLSIDQTKFLLTEAGKAYNTEINDLLISALVRANYKISNQYSFSIMLESHGREEISNKVKLDRTMGWFTYIYPIVFETIDDNLKNTIINTKETIRRVPHNGIGYGVLKDRLPIIKPSILFNYLGQMDSALETEESSNSLGIGGSSVEGNNIFIGLSINSAITSDRLIVTIDSSSSAFSLELVEEIATYYKKSLEEIIAHCCSRKTNEKTLSDYSIKNLENNDLLTIVNSVKQGYEIENIFSLTSMQESMLIQSVSNEKSTCYVVQETFITKKIFDKEYMQKSLELLSSRYEVLRTIFIYSGFDKPKQVVLNNGYIEFEQIDLSNLSGKDAESELQKLLKEDVERGFIMENNLLLRVKNVIMPSRKNRMIWTYHHMILDGWCMAILFKGFFEYYKKIEAGELLSSLTQEIANQKNTSQNYGRFIEWIEEKDKTLSMNYWKSLLQDYENIADIRRSSSEEVKNQVEKKVVTLSKKLTRDIMLLASKNNLTISTILKSVWGTVLQNYNYTDDVVFGEVVSGRNTDELDVESVVGLCINTIPVRVKTTRTMTVLELLQKMQRQSIESQNHWYCSLAEIQSLTTQKNNLIKNLFVYENYYMDEKVYDNMSQSFDLTLETSREQTSYMLNVIGYYDNSTESLKLVVMYDPNQYNSESICRLTNNIEKTVSCFVENPYEILREIDYILEDEAEMICNDFNCPVTVSSAAKTITELFDEQVKKYSEKTALSFYENQLSYRVLNERANQLAHELRAKGIKPNDKIVIIVERSFEMIIGILGIIKAGAAFVPIDMSYPKERIRFMISDCSPKAIIISDKVNIETNLSIINLNEPTLWLNPIENLENINEIADLAYVIYTSGSTGTPKGVEINHGNVVNMRNGLSDIYSVDPLNDKVLQFANYIFDAFIWEFTLSLLMGAELVLIDLDTIRDFSQFDIYVSKAEISFLLLPPQYYLQTDIKNMKVLTTGGAASNMEIVKKALNNKQYVNAYGPTENTVLSTYWLHRSNQIIPEEIPIGKPLKNIQTYILNGKYLCGVEQIGELFLAGNSLSSGYVNRVDITEKAFKKNPYGAGKLYKTGDLARWLPDGNIEYLGRLDDQIKIRGFRIEKKEIERTFRKINGVKDVIVLEKKDKSGEVILVTYFLSEQKLNISSLRTDLSKHLPQYMIPDFIVQIEEIPFTKSGKVDSEKLNSIELISRDASKDDARNEYEKILKSIWVEILDLDEISVFDNFYHIGGNSLKVSQMFSQINKIYPNCLSIGDIFINPSIASLAEQILKNNTKMLPIRQMTFPREYFGSKKQFSNQSSQHLKKDIKHTIKELFIKNENELFLNLLFAYSYLLTETVTSDRVTIFSAFYDNYFFMDESFSHIKDLNELKKIIDKKLSSAQIKSEFKERVIFSKRGILPTLLFNPMPDYLNNHFADFSIVVYADAADVKIELHVKNHRISKESTEKFYNLFNIILEKIIK